MITKLIAAAAGAAAAAIILSPISNADTQEPTNVEVSASSLLSTPCNNITCRPWYNNPGGYKNGLNESSQKMLDRIVERRYHPVP